ncbi:hypothetical protein CHU98_g11230, partial [Xylaria longipes]
MDQVAADDEPPIDHTTYLAIVKTNIILQHQSEALSNLARYFGSGSGNLHHDEPQLSRAGWTSTLPLAQPRGWRIQPVLRPAARHKANNARLPTYLLEEMHPARLVACLNLNQAPGSYKPKPLLVAAERNGDGSLSNHRITTAVRRNLPIAESPHMQADQQQARIRCKLLLTALLPSYLKDVDQLPAFACLRMRSQVSRDLRTTPGRRTACSLPVSTFSGTGQKDLAAAAPNTGGWVPYLLRTAPHPTRAQCDSLFLLAGAIRDRTIVDPNRQASQKRRKQWACARSHPTNALDRCTDGPSFVDPPSSPPPPPPPARFSPSPPQLRSSAPIATPPSPTSTTATALVVAA